METVAIFGSADYPYPELVRDYVFKVLAPGATVAVGGNEGPDAWAEAAAAECGVTAGLSLDNNLFRPTLKKADNSRPLVSDANRELARDAQRAVIFFDGHSAHSNRVTLGTAELFTRRDKQVTYVHTRISSMFEVSAQLLVNPVNTQGVMGRGLAAQFKKRYALCMPAYKAGCQAGIIFPGQLHYVNVAPRTTVCNFPTKIRWADDSKLEYIELGMVALANYIRTHNIESVAIPALGCGLGRLDFFKVWPIIDRTLGGIPGLVVHLYPPQED